MASSRSQSTIRNKIASRNGIDTDTFARTMLDEASGYHKRAEFCDPGGGYALGLVNNFGCRKQSVDASVWVIAIIYK